MRNRLKEEEKIERTIRGLLKLPENRRCINCNSLGPQYVCTTFLTFVCTSCSGVHREFTHRVKSVSVAKFTAEEVSALQAGGNERARQIYFKDWDPERHSLPDGSNLHRLRDFIKHVYVDRKYTGERSKELPRLRLSDKDKDESIESGKFTIFEGRSRSPQKEGNQERYNSERSSPYGRNDDRHIRYYYDERKSPRYYKANSRFGGYKRSPVCFEVVDDRFRDDEYGNRRISSGETTLRSSRSPDRKKNIYGSHSPVVNHSKESLGEKMQALRIGEISKVNDGKAVDDSARNQKKTVSSNKQESAQKIVSVNNQESAHGNPVKHEKRISESLIDFSTEFEPPDSATMSQSQHVSSYENISGQALIETSNKEKPSHGPNANTLETLLLDQPSALVTDGGSTWQQTTTSIGAPKNEDTTTGVDSQIHPVETKSNNRMEIPADLFAASYESIPAPVSGWQTGPPSSMGYNMQYYSNTMPVPAFSNSASSNPFEINNGRSQFPSMTMSQGALPNVSSSNASMISSQLPSSGSDLTPSAYLEQQMQNNMISSRPQGIGGFGSDGADFGSLNTSAPSNTSSFASMRGNPFE